MIVELAGLAMLPAIAQHLARARGGAGDDVAQPEDLAALAGEALEAEDYPLAQALLEHALERAPGSALLRFDLAWAIEQQGRLAEALALYRVAATLGEQDAAWNAALCAARLGDQDLAGSLLLRAAAADPYWALEADEEPRLAQVLQQSDVRAALRRIKEARS